MNFKLREIRENKKISMKAFAKEMGIAISTLSQIEKNNINLTTDKLEKLAGILDVSIGELFGEIPISSNKMYAIKFYPKLMNDIFENTIANKEYQMINIDKTILMTLNINNFFENVIALKVKGNAMFPIIADGDLVFVNTEEENIFDNQIYLINESGILKIRRIKQDNPITKDNFKITSDSKFDVDYKEYNLSREKIKEMIIGRVIFYVRNIF